MCVGAMVHARVGMLVYGAPEPKAGAVLSARCASWTIRGSTTGFRSSAAVLEKECREVMQTFFRDAACRRRWRRRGRRRPRAAEHAGSAAVDGDSPVYNRRLRLRRRLVRGGAHPSAERYRSGRNGGASKASCRVTGTWVRIPPSPPPPSPSARSLPARVGVRLRPTRAARRPRHESHPLRQFRFIIFNYLATRSGFSGQSRAMARRTRQNACLRIDGIAPVSDVGIRVCGRVGSDDWHVGALVHPHRDSEPATAISDRDRRVPESRATAARRREGTQWRRAGGRRSK